VCHAHALIDHSPFLLTESRLSRNQGTKLNARSAASTDGAPAGRRCSEFPEPIENDRDPDPSLRVGFMRTVHNSTVAQRMLLGGPALANRLLDPLERTSEILFGLIMVLTFTSSISLAVGGRAETREVLIGALACNVAWGFVDAVMFLMAKFMERARNLATLRSIGAASQPATAHRLILEGLPPLVSAVLTTSEVETIRHRLSEQGGAHQSIRLTGRDVVAALGVFLLVFLSTFPVVIPFLVMKNAMVALRTSNAIALVMLFITGWSLGRYAGRPGWRVGLGMMAIGVALVATTVALGG
jgi:VIT1/CCC1 family predicted Fe2+/Mn2+ transporter